MPVPSGDKPVAIGASSRLGEISRNASNTEPAKLFAVFVVDTEHKDLTAANHTGGSR